MVFSIAVLCFTIYYVDKLDTEYAQRIHNEGINMLNSNAPDLRRTSDAGVTLLKCPDHKAYRPAKLINNSRDTVQIRSTWIFHGESTLWIKTFVPGQSLIIPNISFQNGFYVLDKFGVKNLGYLNGD